MPNLVLTPLEILLIGGLLSLVSGLSVKFWLSGRYITRAECQVHRELLRGHQRDLRLIFSMLREIVVRLPGMSPEEKAKILNMRANREE